LVLQVESEFWYVFFCCCCCCLASGAGKPSRGAITVNVGDSVAGVLIAVTAGKTIGGATGAMSAPHELECVIRHNLCQKENFTIRYLQVEPPDLQFDGNLRLTQYWRLNVFHTYEGLISPFSSPILFIVSFTPLCLLTRNGGGISISYDAKAWQSVTRESLSWTAA
jgi:hypothetical protein